MRRIEFFEGECLAALKSMSKGKTPGSDGLPAEFYLTFWDILKEDFVEIVNNCFVEGIMPESLRSALITLLFKKDDPQLLKNWRPISLLNVDYKILTKVLVNGIKPLMSAVIHMDQCCAVPGRSAFSDLAWQITVINSLVSSTVARCKNFPPSRGRLDSLQTKIWKFIWSNKPELVRRETCFSNYQQGGLRIIHLELKSKALLIGRVFKFLAADKDAGPWQELMRYYVGRSLGINDNTKPNCTVPTPFYSHLLRVLKEFKVDLILS